MSLGNSLAKHTYKKKNLASLSIAFLRHEWVVSLPCRYCSEDRARYTADIDWPTQPTRGEGTRLNKAWIHCQTKPNTNSWMVKKQTNKQNVVRRWIAPIFKISGTLWEESEFLTLHCLDIISECGISSCAIKTESWDVWWEMGHRLYFICQSRTGKRWPYCQMEHYYHTNINKRE